VLARGGLKVRDFALNQQLCRSHEARGGRLVAPRHAAALGEILLLHRSVPHVRLAKHDEMARLLERVRQHGAPSVRERELPVIVGVVLKLGDADAEAKAAGRRVGG
jgi:hypothetical protein